MFSQPGKNTIYKKLSCEKGKVMETKIKELIYKARGSSRNMKEFAMELGMSPAKLYRIAEGGLRKPVSDDDLEAIAEHAVEGSGVTFGLLKLAVMQDTTARQPEKEVSKDSQDYWELSARRAVMDALFSHNIPFINSTQRHQSFYDFSMEAQIDDFKSMLYFDVRHYSARCDFTGFLYRSVGEYALSGIDAGWHYVVFIGEPEEHNGTRPTMQEHYIEILRQQHTTLNVSVLFINEMPDRSYRIEEVCLNPDAQIIDFNN